MIELVMVILVVGVLAAVAIPRLSSQGFDEQRLYDQTLAALRYAQRTAVAYQRTVCATFTGGTQLSLTYASAYGSATCDTSLAPPGGTTASYIVTAQGAATVSAASFTFDPLGRPSTGQTITAGGRNIVVEGETGYVH